MKYLGVLILGFGFLGSAYFIALGVLLIAAPQRTLALVRIFLGKAKTLRYSETMAKVSRKSAAIWGVLQIAFGLLVIQYLIRSIIYAYSR
jgi:hypothetical protein